MRARATWPDLRKARAGADDVCGACGFPFDPRDAVFESETACAVWCSRECAADSFASGGADDGSRLFDLEAGAFLPRES